MEFTGTFQLNLISKETAIKARHAARRELRGVFIACCLAYVVEVGKQIPVLTGASRSAFLWRAQELFSLLKHFSPEILAVSGVADFEKFLQLTATLAKDAPHVEPSRGTTPRRQKWAAYLSKRGEGPGVFSSDEYLPMLINVGTLGQLAPMFNFNIAIAGDWYLRYYDAGTINASVGDDSWGDAQKYWGGYEVGPWDLEQDGLRAFNRMYRRLVQKVHLSPVYQRSLTFGG